jgi:hypothetical protein
MRSLVRFCYLAAGGPFTTTELHSHVLQTLEVSAADYKLGSLRYDLWKLRAKGLMEKIYAPLTAGILQPFTADNSVPTQKTSSLDRRYLAVVKALDNLVEAVGLKVA